MGSVSAVGSLGLTIASPLAHTLITSGGWQPVMVFFVGLATVTLPAAFFAGGAEKIPGITQSDLAPQAANPTKRTWVERFRASPGTNHWSG